MRYADDTRTNESQAETMGERTKVTDEMLNLYLGGDNTNAEAWEMLLDILNNHWSLEDAQTEIISHYGENK